ncbi:MAG: lipopolysaccharide kinase InaA family protein [Planctomycetota bacterium]
MGSDRRSGEGRRPATEVRLGPDARSALAALGLAEPAELLRGGLGEVVRETPHRRTERLRTASGRECYHKLYGPGAGRIGKIHPRRAPAEVEWARAAALAGAGLPIPPFLCAVWGPEGDRAPSAVLLAGLPGARPLDLVLRDEGPTEARLAWLRGPLLDLVHDLHAAGFQHRDLYAAHVLVAAGDAPVLIDLARVRRQERLARRRRVKDLAALAHSLRDLVPEAFVDEWIRAYGVRSTLPPERLLRSVRRKAARIAAHVPRYDRPA